MPNFYYIKNRECVIFTDYFRTTLFYIINSLPLWLDESSTGKFICPGYESKCLTLCRLLYLLLWPFFLTMAIYTIYIYSTAADNVRYAVVYTKMRKTRFNLFYELRIKFNPKQLCTFVHYLTQRGTPLLLYVYIVAHIVCSLCINILM